MMKRFIPFYFFLILGIWACTPKTAQVIQETDQAAPIEEEAEQTEEVPAPFVIASQVVVHTVLCNKLF